MSARGREVADAMSESKGMTKRQKRNWHIITKFEPES